MLQSPYREALMSEPVSNWLKSFGYVVYCEIPWYGRSVDIVAERNGVQIAVELKLHFSTGLLRQCIPLQCATPYVYAAARPGYRRQTLDKFIERGIGILVVEGTAVSVVHRPKDQHLEFKPSRFKLEQFEPGGVAGYPTMAGIGPAQDCYDRVQAYKAKNPKASWGEIWKNVPNHYKNRHTLRQSMSAVYCDRIAKAQRLGASRCLT